MQIPILIEPIADGRYRARAGEPFALTAEGQTGPEAMDALEALIRERLSSGARFHVLTVAGNLPDPMDPLPGETKDDWFFRHMREAIAENRRAEDGDLS